MPFVMRSGWFQGRPDVPKTPPHRWPEQAAILALFLSLSVALVWNRPDWTHGLIATSGADAWSSVWFLNWFPYAILHGDTPLHSAFLYAPDGYDLTWATSIPTLALLAAPITLLFGANLSFNILTALAPGLDGYCATLMLIACGGRRSAAILGGIFYGFSPFEIGQLQGHLNLDLTACVPLACLLIVRRVQGRIGARWFVAGLAVVMLAQFGLSTEIFASFCSLGAAAWGLFLVLSPGPLRARLLRTALLVVEAMAIVALVALPWLLNMAQGARRIPGFVNPAWMYSANLLNVVVPTELTWLGGALFRSVSASFSGNLSEQGCYLGLPLLAILALLGWERRHDRLIVALLVLIAGLVLASLGPSLHVGTWDSHLPLPWWLAGHLPLLRGALPVRFSLYAGLGCAVAACVWQAHALTAVGARLRLGLLVLAVIAVLPRPGAVGWSRMPLLPFFEPARIDAAIGQDRTLLILPYLISGTADLAGATPAMLWQWQSGMRFRQSGGYVSFVPYPEARSRLLQHLMHGERGRYFENDLSAYVATSGVSAIAAGPGTTPSLLSGLDALAWQTRQAGGVMLVVPPAAATLRYAALGGQSWFTSGETCWMGQEITVVTHDRTAILHIDGRGIPLPDTKITVRSDSGTTIRTIRAQGQLDIALPANGRFTIVPAHSFRPHIVWKTPDKRVLSFQVSLEPGP